MAERIEAEIAPNDTGTENNLRLTDRAWRPFVRGFNKRSI